VSGNTSSILLDPSSGLLKSSYEKFLPLIIIGLNATLFLPTMGHGFLTDDFLHLTSVEYGTLRQGLLGANGGPFYSPTAWLSYSLDWALWGWNPYAFAAVNLLLHSANIFLLYLFARRLWRSHIAGWWAALGYALLFPANVSAVMFIGTRAHLFVVCFALASLLSALWLARTEDRKFSALLSTVFFATLAVFSKESGVTAPAAIALLLLHERRSAHGGKPSIPTIAGLFAALSAAVAAYAVIRSRSGAVHITFGCKPFQYCPTAGTLIENLLRYGWRTFGLLSLVAVAIAMSQYLRGYRPRLDLVTKDDLLFSVLLFGVTIAPFILISSRSFIYSYLPGVAAALLLGATARSLHEKVSPVPSRHIRLAPVPVILVVAVYATVMVIHSLKWMRNADVSAMVLNQIAAQSIKPEPNTFFVLRYSGKDKDIRMSDALGLGWGFGCALKLLYSSPTVNGTILQDGQEGQEGAACPECEKPHVINLTYSLDSRKAPRVTVVRD
jgi:hypothetical protein